jgi:alpha-D-xyloside xylohydrolase
MPSQNLLRLALCLIPFTAAFAQQDPHVTVQQSPTGLTAHIDDETLHLIVCQPTVIHVIAGPGDPSPATDPQQQPWITPNSCPGAKFTFAQDAHFATLTTSAVKVSLSLRGGNLTYTKADAAPDGNHIASSDLLREGNQVPRTYEPATVNNEQTHHVIGRFRPNNTEAFYGLGQHQSGVFNYRGSVVELGQNNTDIAIPLLLSTKGYAILWNTASFTYFDNRFPLEANFDTLAADTVDYYFLYGPEFDSIIHHYRDLTGHTPLFPLWGYGYIQSKDRYRSQQEILYVAHEYRARHIPIDAIVQDWFWWRHDGEGDPLFNDNYPDVPAELRDLHQNHFHTMISVWGLMDANSANFKKIESLDFDIPKTHVYDPSNPGARDFFWNNLVGPLHAQGWDSFWLDSAEPEEYFPHVGDAILRNKQLHMGSGARYTNIFPLLHTGNVTQHWKDADAAHPESAKRTLILTRSAFLGQQKNGAVSWSGDVYSTFWGLQHQIAAGLNFALSGNPYWATDIGGYWPPDGRSNDPKDPNPFDPTNPNYEELYTRWFQFGAFCPVFRSHGHRPHNEIWTYSKVEPILLTYDKLRYRLMPYIYSSAWRVTDADYTLMRPLVMDWRTDPNTHNIADQFMFGPSILVSPVTQAGATSRTLYLPASPAWFDLWTGTSQPGSRQITAEAPLDRLPLYVRAGSILPLGPEIEYTNQNPSAPLELRIYPGADADFNLYEDEGDTYAYEKGAHTLIPIHWTDATRTLTIGDRQGTYPNMPTTRTFTLVLVAPNHGIGESLTSNPDKSVTYKGSTISTHL